jgi:uncharacterized protein DUF2846
VKPLVVLMAAALFSFALAAQGNGPADVPSTDKATIVVFREHLFFYGDGYEPFLSLDGNKIGRLHDGSWFSIDVGAGKHVIGVGALLLDPASIDVTTTAGQTVYIRFELLKKNLVVPTSAGKFVQVNAAKAQPEIAKLRRLPVEQKPKPVSNH